MEHMIEYITLLMYSDDLLNRFPNNLPLLSARAHSKCVSPRNYNSTTVINHHRQNSNYSNLVKKVHNRA